MKEPRVIRRPLLKTVVRKPKDDPIEDDTIKSRLTALIQAVLDESSFDPVIKRVVSNMITNFLRKASDESLEEKIKQLRDEIIPFILNGKADEEHAELTENSHPNG